MTSTVHLFDQVTRYIQQVGILICDRNSIAKNVCNVVIGSLREMLFKGELAGVPQRSSVSLNSCLFSTFLTSSCGARVSYSNTKDIRSCLDKVLSDFSLRFVFASICQICYIQNQTLIYVALSHNFDHQIAIIIDFNDCECDLPLCELFHLLLYDIAIR